VESSTAPAAAAPAAGPAPAPATAAPSSGGGAAGGVAVPEPPKPAPKSLVSRMEKKLENPRAERPSAQGAGRLELAVAPWGEVLVDGKRRGVSPPLRVIELPAGAHTIEIRNSTFPAHVSNVQVKAGEAVRIQHRFR
jgi:eukaryotic-like serine/threonine-protein kinase